MRKTILLAALSASLLGATAAPGLAADALDVRVSAGHYHGALPFRPVVGRVDAERAANMVGLADVDDVDRDGALWTVTGTDLRDRDMTVVVDARSGRVVDARYD